MFFNPTGIQSPVGALFSPVLLLLLRRNQLNLNNEQRKHLAGTLRIVNFAQFAAFGWPALNNGDYIVLLLVILAFVNAAIVSLYVLEGCKS